MSFADRENTATVPSELLESGQRFGIDFGSSGIKFVYATDEDMQEYSNDPVKTFRKLRTITFGRNELVEGLHFLKQRVGFLSDQRDDASRPTINVTGVGGSQLEKTISEMLNVKLKVQSEIASVVWAFCYLASKLPRRLLLESHDDQVSTQAMKHSMMFTKMMSLCANETIQTYQTEEDKQLYNLIYQNMGSASTETADESNDEPLIESEHGLYPFVLMTCGSGLYALKVTAPGVRSLVDLNTSGGKTMLGVSNKLIGCQSYGELVELASKGDRSKVNVSVAEVFYSESAEDEDNVYKRAGSVEEDQEDMFSFGKLVGVDCAKFRIEDIASAWMDHFVKNLVDTIQLICHVNGIKRVFLHGGLLSHANVRCSIQKEMNKKNAVNYLAAKASPIVFDFVKFPQHLSAVGCLVLSQRDQAEKD